MTILEFLYNTVPGRFLLKSLTGPRLSRICGNFLDSELSSFLIQPFVKQNAIQLSDYETTDIKSFNDFFKENKTGQASDRYGGKSFNRTM